MNNQDRSDTGARPSAMAAPGRNGPCIELWIVLQNELIEKERRLGGVAREVAAGRQSLQTLRSMNASVEGERELSRALLGAMRDGPEETKS